MNVYQEFLNRRDCILLLVDIQKVMLDLCVDPDRTVFNTAALIEVAELFEIPVLCYGPKFREIRRVPAGTDQ